MVTLLDFPDPRSAGDDDILGVGGNLQWKNLVEAYRQGIFPWPIDGWPLPWFSPRERAVMFFSELHVPKSLAKAARRRDLRFTIDAAFGEVIRACARTRRRGQRGTWITAEMLDAYIELHDRGYAHSVETWQGNTLVGGLYGVSVDGAFSGESMFHTMTNASKLALLHLVDHLGARGLDWIDVQTMTPHMESLGARLLPRDEFLELLERTHALRLSVFG